MTREEAIKILKSKTVRMAIKVLEQEPCKDAISRQAVLDLVDSYSESQSNVEDVTQDIISDILALPPVNPQPIRGRWIKKEYWKPLAFDTFPAMHDDYDEKTHSVKEYRYYCSHCNYHPEYTLTKFCPECGVRMDKSQEKER